MPRPVNLDALIEKEAAARKRKADADAALAKRQHKRRAAERRDLDDRIHALGTMLHSLYPEETLAEIAQRLQLTASPALNGHRSPVTKGKAVASSSVQRGAETDGPSGDL